MYWELDLELRAPCLESLRLRCREAVCKKPMQLPQLRYLHHELPDLRASVLRNCAMLQRVQIGPSSMHQQGWMHEAHRVASLASHAASKLQSSSSAAHVHIHGGIINSCQSECE